MAYSHKQMVMINQSPHNVRHDSKHEYNSVYDRSPCTISWTSNAIPLETCEKANACEYRDIHLKHEECRKQIPDPTVTWSPTTSSLGIPQQLGSEKFSAFNLNIDFNYCIAGYFRNRTFRRSSQIWVSKVIPCQNIWKCVCALARN